MEINKVNVENGLIFWEVMFVWGNLFSALPFHPSPGYFYLFQFF